jgi:hypothetical protein
LARKWQADINTGTVAVPIWTPIYGIQELTPSPNAPNLEDDNVYEAGGWTGQTKTALSWSLEFKLVRRTDAASAITYDPGQEKLRTLSYTFGASGVANIRWYDRNGGIEAFSGFGEVSWEPDGGSQTDLETITVTVTGKSDRLIITNPVAAALPLPVVNSVTPSAGLLAAGGGLIVIIGDNFMDANGNNVVTAVTGVKVTGTNALEWVVESRYRIVARYPAKAAGPYNVTVTNTTGTSATGATNAVVYV